MNESPNPSPTPAEISEQIGALRRQVSTLLFALIVVTGTLTAYLYYESRVYAKEIAAIKPQALQVIQISRQSRPKVEAFVKELITYGQKNPQFAQEVLKKFDLVPPPATATPAKKK
jgi:hypothetical protein